MENGRDLIECAMLSLALIMLDPFYRLVISFVFFTLPVFTVNCRTIQGFMVLIEKEWCSFAFPFYVKKKLPEGPPEILRVCVSFRLFSLTCT